MIIIPVTITDEARVRMAPYGLHKYQTDKFLLRPYMKKLKCFPSSDSNVS